MDVYFLKKVVKIEKSKVIFLQMWSQDSEKRQSHGLFILRSGEIWKTALK